MSAPSIPSSYSITQSFATPINMNSAVSGGVSMMLLGDDNQPITTNMNASMRIENLPDFKMEDFFALIRALKEMKVRVQMPINMNFGVSVFPFSLFGVDVLQFSICGEPQIIIDDYKPNAYERCEVSCESC